MRTVFSAIAISFALVQTAFAGSIYSGARIESSSPGVHSENVYPLSRPAKRKYVNSFADFKDHTSSHIERVVNMAVDAAHAHPDLFPGVDLEILRDYASWHDREKSLKDFATKLYQAYGKKVKSNSGKVIPGFEHYFEMIDKLNAAGEEYERQFFLKFNTNHRFMTPDGKYTPLAKLYQTVVKAVDRVDRALSEVSPEEFGKQMETVSEYARKNPGLISDVELKIAAYYEAPVSEAERIQYLRKYVTPTQSLEHLMSEYKTISRYSVVNQNSTFRAYQYRLQHKAAFSCIVKSVNARFNHLGISLH